MSFGFAPSDIVLGLQACKWIWDNCFDKNNAADERYRQFGRDVQGLETRLAELKTALENALRRYEHPDLDAADLKRDTKNLVGDFTKTLQECREVLEKNVKLKRNRAGIIQNVMWAATAEDRVDALRRKIQFHTQKIYLIIEPVSLGLLTTIDGKMDEMLELMHTHFSITQPLESIPNWLDVRFREAILENAPMNYRGIDKMPLKEGFDALYGHFRQSTYAFRDRETAEQTAEQYLNLLKSQWLFETLKKGETFKQTHPGSLYPRTIAQVEQRILAQHRRIERNEVVVFSDEDLKKLSNTAFLIWPTEQKAQNKFMTDPSVGEEEILKLSLPSSSGAQKDGLVIFRTGPSTLRIVRNVMPDGSGTPYYESERFNIHIDRFVPFYAMHQISGSSEQARPARSVGICRGNETGITSYEIPDERDLLNFQRAITGYQVVEDKNASWALNHSGKFRPDLQKGTGRIQLWYSKPLTQTLPERRESAVSQTSNSTSSIRSPFSASSNTVVDKVLEGGDRSRVSVHERSDTESTIGISTPPPPVLLVYARARGEYSYIHLELTLGVQIVPSACNCNKSSTTCRRIVIENRPKNSDLPFHVRKMTVPTEQLHTWNLSIFAQPRHPLYDNRSSVQILKCKFLALDFATVAEKLEFIRKFNTALVLRDDAEKEVRRIIKRTAWMAEKPDQTGIEDISRRGSFRDEKERRLSILEGQTLVDEAPVLRPISSFAGIDIKDSTDKIFG